MPCPRAAQQQSYNRPEENRDQSGRVVRLAEAMMIPRMVPPVSHRRLGISLRGVMRTVQRVGELVSDAQKSVAEQERYQKHQRRSSLHYLRFENQGYTPLSQPRHLLA